MARRIVVVPHDPAWGRAFAAEARAIRAALGENCLAVCHIGSTAVEGLKAKPILDIAVGLWTMEDAAVLVRPLEELGYVYRPKSGTPERLFFAKGPEERRTHYLHCEVYGSASWRGQLLFRDRLIQNPSCGRPIRR